MMFSNASECPQQPMASYTAIKSVKDPKIRHFWTRPKMSIFVYFGDFFQPSQISKQLVLWRFWGHKRTIGPPWTLGRPPKRVPVKIFWTRKNIFFKKNPPNSYTKNQKKPSFFSKTKKTSFFSKNQKNPTFKKPRSWFLGLKTKKPKKKPRTWFFWFFLVFCKPKFSCRG